MRPFFVRFSARSGSIPKSVKRCFATYSAASDTVTSLLIKSFSSIKSFLNPFFGLNGFEDEAPPREKRDPPREGRPPLSEEKDLPDPDENLEEDERADCEACAPPVVIVYIKKQTLILI